MTINKSQYTLLFFVSWIFCYLIFPSWSLPIPVIARASIFFGLLIYFFIFGYAMNRLFNGLRIEKPVIVKTTDWFENLTGNVMLVVLCCIAVILHIRPISLPLLIIGDETIHSGNGLWVYHYVDSHWQSLFQIAVWVIIALLIVMRKVKPAGNFMVNKLNNMIVGSNRQNLSKYLLGVLGGGFLVAYFLVFQNIISLPNLVRYPPVSKIIYFLTYSAFGINHVYPRIIQLIFYVLCAVYLYRIINLYENKNTALLGASIYLFLPVSFAYAALGELASGVTFLIVAISFYFLRYIRDGDKRDLVLVTYLIGIGFLYKDPLSLMFVICFLFLLAYKIKTGQFNALTDFKVLSLSLVPIIPWMILARAFSWRSYTFQLSNFTSLDSKVVNYVFLLSSNLSTIIFILFLLSILYVGYFKRNALTCFFGLLLIVYYFFTVSDISWIDPRLSLTFYPTIAVFLSLFISYIIKIIKWRHAFKLCLTALIAYLITISANPSLNNRYLTLMNQKLQYYPSEEAMKWVRDNVKNGEKISTIRILSSLFYVVKYNIGRDKVIDLRYSSEEISTLEKLKEFYKKNNLSYIMFPYSPAYIKLDVHAKIFQHLKENANNEFMEIAKFILDDNVIYIYKLNEY